MSTRPRTPGHGAPAPGKLPITELVAMKESRSPIASTRNKQSIRMYPFILSPPII